LSAPKLANPLFCALDTPALEHARSLADELAGVVGGIKLGLEFFTACGPEGVAQLADSGLPVFLDLKLHDIPNTVAGAVQSLARLPVAFTTLHAAGGRAMMEAAVAARARAGRSDLRLLAVTVLTSLDERDLRVLGMSGGVAERVVALARLALEAGMDGLVCSPRELRPLRAHFGDGPLLVAPGIRPQAAGDDQKRVASPQAALNAGADMLVVGRPITASTNPRAAAEAILAAIRGSG